MQEKGDSCFDFTDILITDPEDFQTNSNPWISPTYFLQETALRDELLLDFPRKMGPCPEDVKSVSDDFKPYKYQTPKSKWKSESPKKALNELPHRQRTFSQLYSFKSSRAFTLRICQLTSISIGVIILFCLLVNKSDSLNYRKSVPSKMINFDSWVTSPIQHNLPDATNLLDLENFHFILNNASKCSPDRENEEIFFIILVHSAPKNALERQAIRNTYGSVKTFRNLSIRLIFLLGNSESDNCLISKESDMHGDIVQSRNFEDSYMNLTYKHLMGYKWITEYCPGASFVLKTDDDAFIDIFQLIDFMKRTFGKNVNQTLMCNVLPEGTHPVRSTDTSKDFQRKKWAVTQEEYAPEVYPKYCSGLAYLASLDVIRDLLSISQSVKCHFFVDDVFVTGVLRQLANVEPLYLNLRYLYEPERYRKWIKRDEENSVSDDTEKSNNGFDYKNKSIQKLPFMFLHVERGDLLAYEMKALWKKVIGN